MVQHLNLFVIRKRYFSRIATNTACYGCPGTGGGIRCLGIVKGMK